MRVLGGREIHPINVRVGGFYRCPSPDELADLRGSVEQALTLAEETVRFVAGFDFPPIEEDYEFVALRPPDEYPMNEGPIESSTGLRLDAEQYEDAFEEVHVAHSNALHSVRKGGGSYLVGPMARYALNHDRLGSRARAVAQEVGLEPVVRNPYRSVIVRAVEVVFACEEALRIIDRYHPPDRAFVEPPVIDHPTQGAAATEAPRGLLYHRYELEATGRIRSAKIVAPTSQNQKRIEDDLRHLVARSLDLDEPSLTAACELAIRNHDPCISCATHFLSLDLVRE